MSKFSKWVNEQPSQTRAGQILGRSQATISKWLASGEVPGDACPEISEKTGIKRKDLNARIYQ